MFLTGPSIKDKKSPGSEPAQAKKCKTFNLF